MYRGSKVGLVSCSNGLSRSRQAELDRLTVILNRLGLEPVLGKCVYEADGLSGGTAAERAEDLMSFYQDDEVEIIFDISGGDIANEILPYLDFDRIGRSGKWFYGYSDLTTLINAIYAKTGRPSVLYQIRNLAGADGERQIERFSDMLWSGTEEFFTFPCRYLQGSQLEGTLVGGNIRCLLKLAGTEYWPDMEDKILLLESYGGTQAQMITYLSQLQQMGVFRQIRGILLGTFTKMEQLGSSPSMEELVCRLAGPELPVVKTGQIGHNPDSSAIVIGGYTCLQNIRDEHRPMHG